MPSQAAADPPENPKNKSPPAKSEGDWAMLLALLQLGKLSLITVLLPDLIPVYATLTIMYTLLGTGLLPDPALLLPGTGRCLNALGRHILTATHAIAAPHATTATSHASTTSSRKGHAAGTQGRSKNHNHQ